MEDVFQVEAYSNADFSEPHSLLINHLRNRVPGGFEPQFILDLGAGSGDISRRLQKAFPKARLTMVDGSQEMISWNERVWEKENLPKANFCVSRIQDFVIDQSYDLIFANSLLHHVTDPFDFWSCIQRSVSTGTFVFLSDLLRPESIKKVEEMTLRYCGSDSQILQNDFSKSLMAAYSLKEIESMLVMIKWDEKIKLEQISDRHWIAFGSIE